MDIAEEIDDLFLGDAEVFWVKLDPPLQLDLEASHVIIGARAVYCFS